MMVSSLHQVSQKGYYIAIISTNVETNNPESELKLGLELVGDILQKFVKVFSINLDKWYLWTNQ